MPITNPQAIAFSNNYARRAADKLAQTYFFAKSLLAQWAQVSTLFPNDATVLQDSAAPNGVDATGGDGRLVVTGAKITSIVTRCQEIVNWFEKDLVASPFGATADNATLNTVTAVAVNPNP